MHDEKDGIGNVWVIGYSLKVEVTVVEVSVLSCSCETCSNLIPDPMFFSK